MVKIKEVIVVEGRYDKNLCKQCFDCTVIETAGFGIFKNHEKAALLKRLAATRGLIVLTDSDKAGFVIRNHLKGILPPEQIKHAYIPEIRGKERRKEKPSAEGLLGVEGMTREVLTNALRRAGATFNEEESTVPRAELTRADLYFAGLSGTPDASEKREKFLKSLDLPTSLKANALLDVVNILFTKEEFYQYTEVSEK